LAIEPAKYLTYTEAVVHHIELMRALGEVRFGIFDRALIESALARPKHAATYDEADLPAQAATLCYGLIKNHPWVGGNKRTATHLTDHFLRINGSEIRAASTAIVAMVQEIESDRMDLPALTRWMSEHVYSLH
jgi:death-on-curing protein